MLWIVVAHLDAANGLGALAYALSARDALIWVIPLDLMQEAVRLVAARAYAPLTD
jgi:hypothetical protein